MILSAADKDGNLPPQRWNALQQQIAVLVLTYFLSVHSGGVYTLDHQGDLLPQSAFMRQLWSQVKAGTSLGTQQQAAILRKALVSAPDLVQALERATINPFLLFDVLLSDAQDAYKTYVPQYAYTWTDQRTLSDRVLFVAAQTRQKVGALTRALLAEQKPAKDVADTLTTYLTGTLIRRNKLYGTNARFEASRLLATETALAYNRASVMSALQNPFADQAEVFVSPAHKGTDSCDEVVAGNPYAITEVPIPPFHAFCACGVRFIISGKIQTTLETIRSQPELLNVRGALSPGFDELLLRGGGVNA